MHSRNTVSAWLVLLVIFCVPLTAFAAIDKSNLKTFDGIANFAAYSSTNSFSHVVVLYFWLESFGD